MPDITTGVTFGHLPGMPGHMGDVRAGDSGGPPANNPPTCTLTSPTEGQVILNGNNVVLTATANDTDGTVDQVEFFEGANSLNVDTSAPYTYTWVSPAPGSYELKARATDDDLATGDSVIVNIRVNALPTINITSPTEGQVISNGSNVSIAATASDDDGVDQVEFFEGANSLNVDTTSPYSYTWVSPAAGSYTINATATDTDSETTDATGINIRVNALPTVSLTSPTEGQVILNGANVSLAANASDSDGTVSQVEFFEGANSLNVDTSSPYSYTWVAPASGSYSLTAVATDNDSDTNTSTPVNIRVNALPTVSITAPTEGQVILNGNNVVITANASDDDGVDQVEFFEGANSLNVDTTSPYSYTWVSPAAGSYSLTATATDTDSETNTSAAINIRVNALPTCSLTSPTEGQVILNGNNVSLAANASDSDGSIDQVEFFEGANSLNVDTTSPYAYTWVSPAAGSYSMTAVAEDNDGQTTTSTAVNIRVNALPTCSITSPTEGQNFSSGSNVTIDANASDSDGTISQVEFFEGANSLNVDTTSPYSYTWVSPADGDYALTAVATDNDTQTTTSTVINISVGDAFTPDDLTNLDGWYRGDDVNTTGSLVDQWNDKSGNDHHATATGSARPTLVTSAQNGEDALSFDGTDTYLDTGHTYATTFDGDFAITVALMFDDGDPSTTREIFGIRDGFMERMATEQRTSSRIRFYYEADNDSEDMDSGTFPNGATNYYIITFWGDFSGDDELKIRVDGAASGTPVDTSGVTPANFWSTIDVYIGAVNDDDSPTSSNYQGDMLEMVIYRPTGLSEIQDVESYMSDRYDITIS